MIEAKISKFALLLVLVLLCGGIYSEIADINGEMNSLQENPQDALEGEEGQDLDFELDEIEDDMVIDKESLQDTIDHVNELLESGNVSDHERATLEAQVEEIKMLMIEHESMVGDIGELVGEASEIIEDAEREVAKEENQSGTQKEGDNDL